jgi:hypothetical protein
MNCQNIEEINQSIAITKKVVVAIGDSFTAGEELGPDGVVDVNKSYVNVLCSKYLNQEYTPINFGQPGTGNFAAIMRLFLHNVHWHLCEKIVVIFCPSAMHRFDVIADDRAFEVGNEFKTLWGFMCSHLSATKSPWREMHSSYGETIMSPKFEVINTTLQFNILNMWCKEHNAELIIFPAFYSSVYSRNYFKHMLNKKVEREEFSQRIQSDDVYEESDKDYFLNLVPWHKFVKIQNTECFFDLCHIQESGYDPNKNIGHYAGAGVISPDGWIMHRGHPSEKGHDLLAKEVSNIILGR